MTMNGTVRQRRRNGGSRKRDRPCAQVGSKSKEGWLEAAVLSRVWLALSANRRAIPLSHSNPEGRCRAREGVRGWQLGNDLSFVPRFVGMRAPRHCGQDSGHTGI